MNSSTRTMFSPAASRCAWSGSVPTAARRSSKSSARSFIHHATSSMSRSSPLASFAAERSAGAGITTVNLAYCAITSISNSPGSLTTPGGDNLNIYRVRLELLLGVEHQPRVLACLPEIGFIKSRALAPNVDMHRLPIGLARRDPRGAPDQANRRRRNKGCPKPFKYLDQPFAIDAHLSTVTKIACVRRNRYSGKGATKRRKVALVHDRHVAVMKSQRSFRRWGP